MSTMVMGNRAVAGHGVRDAGVATRTRLRLTRRGRVVLAVLLATPLVLGAGALAVNGGGAVASSTASQASFEYVTIQSGQSLWDIAERVAPHADPRDVVSAIIDLNQLPGATVVPGQRLAIPAQYR